MQKLYESNAERQRAYRKRNNRNDIQRLKDWYANNKRRPGNLETIRRYRRQQRKNKIMNTPFITFDGEGMDTPMIVAYSNKKAVYKQIYTLLSASDGKSIQNWTTGLTTKKCLDFLLQYAGKGYCVGFGIGYDVTKMLVDDLREDQLMCLWDYGICLYDDYELKYIPNKLFVVKRGDQSVTLYDTFGFFQKSFIKSLADWNIECPQEIIDGKEKRGSFTAQDKKTVKKYNLIECKLLKEIMEKLRQAMHDADFLPTQWYGAGAIAAAMLEQNGIQYCSTSPQAMIPYFLNAYFGGRNQVLKMGEFDKVWLHDINSAYPHAMRMLPSSIGEWFEVDAQLYDYPWCLYQVEWNLPKDVTITPFPVRTKDKSIHWPLRGSGWYWQPEIWEAFKHYAQYIKIKRVFCFEPKDDELRPFKFIEDYYEKRKQFIEQKSDAQLVLKLGINACYGKLAQSIGRKDRRPPYQNFFWSGYITSRTRASVFSLAMESPNKIIGFSTDGIASQIKLVDNSLEKELGAWEVKQVDDYFILQSGVYTFKEKDEQKYKSRGFRSASVNYDELRAIWRRDGILGKYSYTEKRFIGIGNGLRQDLNLIGNWVDQSREITFTPTSMEYGKWSRNNLWLQLHPPQYVGESLAYEMKVDWTKNQNDLQDIDFDLQTAI